MFDVTQDGMNNPQVAFHCYLNFRIICPPGLELGLYVVPEVPSDPDASSVVCLRFGCFGAIGVP